MEGNSQQAFLAKNFDWKTGYGEIYLNPRNAIKTSITSDFDWKSKYASFTFNQFGPELPAGGINEKGLAIEALVLPNTTLPKSDHNMVNEGEWIQYQLDNFESVEEVISHIDDVSIKKLYVNVHYMICDATANCNILEFINGKRIIHSNLKYKALANHPYKTSVRSLTHPGDYDMPAVAASLTRFKLAAKTQLKSMQVSSFYQKLDLSKLGSYTKWQIVYDLSNQELNFKTSTRKQNTNLKMRDYNLECTTKLQVLTLKGNSKIISKTVNLKSNVMARLLKVSDISKEVKQKIYNKLFHNNCANN